MSLGILEQFKRCNCIKSALNCLFVFCWNVSHNTTHYHMHMILIYPITCRRAVLCGMADYFQSSGIGHYTEFPSYARYGSYIHGPSPDTSQGGRIPPYTPPWPPMDYTAPYQALHGIFSQHLNFVVLTHQPAIPPQLANADRALFP